MEKSLQQHKIYNELSKQETVLLNAINPCLILTTKKIKRLTHWKKTRIHNTIQSLKKKNIITAIKRDSYVVTEKIPEHIFTIATHVTEPSYISFWTAASYYGYTEQQVQAIQVISTKQHTEKRIQEHRIEILTIQPKQFFGYVTIEDFAIAEKERLIIDMLYKPEKCGGIRECKKILKNMWPDCEQKLLLEHLKKFNNISVMARLGYMLESIEIKNNIGEKLHRPSTYILLNPKKQKTKEYNRKWRIIINDK